ncbi:DUF4192 domain-containing protein [Nocardia sp. NPDC051321]|uniref:DUF4192 domain-containing protein n=1 Tax=Nocardia sp. NPDC051321 TaxID=3364323 RepID=UPI0037B5678C
MPTIENPGIFIAHYLAAAPQPPRRSVVLVAAQRLECWPDTHMRGGMAILTDLYLSCDDRLAGDYLATTPILARARQFCQQFQPDAVAVVIIDDPRPNRPVPRESHRELVRLLGDRLRETGTELLDAWILSDTVPGQQWTSLLDGDTGTLPVVPTDNSDLAATQPFPQISETHQFLEQDPDLTGQVQAHLADIRASDAETLAAIGEGVDSMARRREQLRFVLTRIYAADSGAYLSAEDLAQVAIILGEETIRTCLYALATGPRGGSCLPMWSQLVRALPAPERTQAAMLFAVTAYTDGDTALSTTAIDIALADEPTNSAAVTLSTALACSVPPEKIRALFRRGYATAAELGIDLD